jgi:hypothetical protein
LTNSTLLADTASDHNPDSSSTLAETAKACAKARMRIFPLHWATDPGCSCRRASCKTPGLHPRLNDWNIQATANIAIVTKWWKRWPEANIGILGDEPGTYLRFDPKDPLPDAFKAEPFYLPSGQAFHASHRALLSPGKWHFDDSDVPTYTDPSTDLLFSFGGHPGGSTPLAAADFASLKLQQDMAILDPLTSIVFIYSMNKWLIAYQNGTLTESMAVPLHVDEILDFIGRSKHTRGGYRVEQKQAISRRFERLEEIRVSGPNPDTHAKNRTLRGRILNVTYDEANTLFPKKTVPYIFLAKPGDAYWETVVSGDLDLTDFFVPLAALAHYRFGVELMAYQLGLYLLFHFRIREASQNWEQPWRIKTILEGACVEIETERRLFTRFREQFDKAMDRLQKLKLVNGWQYRKGDDDATPVNGWFSHWLKSSIVIDPPPLSRERGRKRAESHRQRLNSSPDQTSKRIATARAT